MRKLPILVVLLLASLMLLAAAASAHAVDLPTAVQKPPVVVEIDDEGEADDGEAEAGDEEGDDSEADEGEECAGEDDEACDEALELDEAEECLLEDASASFTAAPGSGQVRLRIHYRAFAPTQVMVDARLHGSKGALHLGSDRTRFRRAGVFHYSFDLRSKQMAKAIAAKDFEVDLYAVGTPADCAMHLATRGSRQAK